MDQAAAFERFFEEVEPRLRRAFVGSHGVDGAGDAAAEAMAWAWERWDEVETMENAAGFLYRVGQSRTRARRVPVLPRPETIGVPEVEPQLVPALLSLSPAQRTAVWLVHGCGWSYAEAAEAMGNSASAVGTHVSRALGHLRTAFEVTDA